MASSPSSVAVARRYLGPVLAALAYCSVTAATVALINHHVLEPYMVPTNYRAYRCSAHQAAAAAAVARRMSYFMRLKQWRFVQENGANGIRRLRRCPDCTRNLYYCLTCS